LVEREELRMSTVRWNAVGVDCAPADFARVVAFYAGLLGLEVVDKEPRVLLDPAGHPFCLWS
jgi:hypothetical protein